MFPPYVKSECVYPCVLLISGVEYDNKIIRECSIEKWRDKTPKLSQKGFFSIHGANCIAAVMM